MGTGFKYTVRWNMLGSLVPPWSTTVLCIAMLITPATSAAKGLTNEPPPMCVIGGGLSGLVIANKLQEAGRDVVLFEKSLDHIGGKLDSMKDLDVPWEKGPTHFSEVDTALLRYIRKYQLNTTELPSGSFGVFNPETGRSYFKLRGNLTKLEREWGSLEKRYVQIRQTYPSWIFEPGSFERMIHLRREFPALFYSTEEWINYHSLQGLTYPFHIILTSAGYGLLKDLPAIYALKFLTPAYLNTSLNFIADKESPHSGFYSMNVGFKELAFRLAKDLRQVYMGYNLFFLHRSEYGKSGTMRARFALGIGNSQQTFNCSKVIFAFPPLLSKLGRMVDDISIEEKTIFSLVKVHKYFSTGHFLGPDGGNVVYVGPTDQAVEGDGRPTALVRTGNKGNAYEIHSWLYGRYDSGPQKEDYVYVDWITRGFINKVTNRTASLSFFEGYEHFPHASKEDIANDFFGKWAWMQGRGEVYYATTVSSFDSMNNAIQNAEFLARRILNE